MINIDRIILGDNQFFGVNHMSQDKGRASEQKFKDINEIKRMLYYALDNGVKGIMFSTHPSIYQITDMMRKDPAIKKEFNIYVNVPYIVKYMTMINKMGAYRTIKQVLCGQSLGEKAAYMCKAGWNVLTGNYLKITNRLVDAEMNPFYGLNVKAIFLHNILCDLALGYNMINVIKNFHDYIQKKHGAIPAFGTINYPRFCKLLADANIPEALVMTSLNKRGFLMNPSRIATEDAIKKTKHTVLAMATLASGSIPPREAYEYVFSIPGIKHVVVGLSSKEHADETFKILRKYV